jgi:hypothetical protein
VVDVFAVAVVVADRRASCPRDAAASPLSLPAGTLCRTIFILTALSTLVQSARITNCKNSNAKLPALKKKKKAPPRRFFFTAFFLVAHLLLRDGTLESCVIIVAFPSRRGLFCVPNTDSPC